jgi:hypothetical protein
VLRLRLYPFACVTCDSQPDLQRSTTARGRGKGQPRGEVILFPFINTENIHNNSL